MKGVSGLTQASDPNPKTDESPRYTTTSDLTRGVDHCTGFRAGAARDIGGFYRHICT